MTSRLNPEAQAALDAVRAGGQQPRPESERGLPDWGLAALDRARAEAVNLTPFERRVLAALENLDARLKALEGKCPLCGLQPEPKDACADIECPAGLKALEGERGKR